MRLPIEQYVVDIVTKLRNDNKLSQRAFADRIGLSAGFIGDIESNREGSNYNLEHINIIAKEFNLPPKFFLPDKAL